MNYTLILALHSLVRWFVLASLVVAIYRGYAGWLGNKAFSGLDNRIRHWTATIAHTQLVIGIWLYFISPLIDYFLHHYSEAVHEREIRFFGMEHNIMMLLAIIIITIGSAKAKRKKTDKEKFQTMTIWFSIALLIIVLSIPWPFSPLTQRPLYRPF